MQHLSTPAQLRHRAKAVIACMLVILVAWLSIFALHSSVHRSFHADDQGDHSCAICLFAHGQLAASVGTVIFIFVAAAGITLLCPPFATPFSTADFLLLPERAPPARLRLPVR